MCVNVGMQVYVHSEEEPHTFGQWLRNLAQGTQEYADCYISVWAA